MNFLIQTCAPVLNLPKENRHCADLAAAIQEIFPMEAEDAILLWNNIPVRIGYKYDLSVMIDDLMPLLERLINHTVGLTKTHWGSDTFKANWSLQWDHDILQIDSTWFSILGDYEELLNQRSHLKVSLRLFLQEWIKLLRKIRHCIEFAQVTFVDEVTWHTLCKLTDE